MEDRALGPKAVHCSPQLHAQVVKFGYWLQVYINQITLRLEINIKGDVAQMVDPPHLQSNLHRLFFCLWPMDTLFLFATPSVQK